MKAGRVIDMVTDDVILSQVEFTYARNGNMTTVPKPADPTTSFTATYDAWNRQVKFVDTATPDTVAEYAYDGAKRRIIQKSYVNGTLDETRHIYYTSSWQAIEERLGPSPESAAPDRQFVWGPLYIDHILLRDRDTSVPPTGTLSDAHHHPCFCT